MTRCEEQILALAMRACADEPGFDVVCEDALLEYFESGGEDVVFRACSGRWGPCTFFGVMVLFETAMEKARALVGWHIVNGWSLSRWPLTRQQILWSQVMLTVGEGHHLQRGDLVTIDVEGRAVRAAVLEPGASRLRLGPVPVAPAATTPRVERRRRNPPFFPPNLTVARERGRRAKATSRTQRPPMR